MGKENRTRTVSLDKLRKDLIDSSYGESPYNFSPRKRSKVIREMSESIQTEARENRIKQIKSEELAKRIILD